MRDETQRAPDTFDAALEVTNDVSGEILRVQQLLQQTFETQQIELLNGLAVYIHKLGTARGGTNYRQSVQEFARDALTELYLEAMNCAAKFDAQREPLPWLFGLAKNVCLRQRERHFRAQNRAMTREQSWSDLPREADESLSDAVERLTKHAAHALQSPLEAKHALNKLIEPLNEHERDIIARFVLLKLDSQTVAEQLHCTPVAARKRLQRALDKLRAANGAVENTDAQIHKSHTAKMPSSQHDTWTRATTEAKHSDTKSEVSADA